MSSPLSQERGALSNLPDEDYDVPYNLGEAPGSHLKAIEQEATDIAKGQLDKVMKSMDYYHAPDKGSGKLFDFKPMKPGVRKDYEFLVEGLLRAGTNVLSGPRGAGKTSFLAPFACAIGGLIPHYPMDIKLRRRVIMYTEDRAQLTRLFDSMMGDGYMDVTHDELNRWVHISDAERISIEDIAEHAEELKKMMTPNRKADGGVYPACPLVVFDTLSAGIDMDEISDNGEVAKEIAKMRSALDGKASLLLVGHTAKDAGRQLQTMLGAQAWEANTIGAITLKVDGENRHIEINKDRFAAPMKRFNLRPIRTSCQGLDVLGRPTTIHDLYSELVPMTKEEEAESQMTQEEKREGNDQRREDVFLAALMETLSETDEVGSVKYPKGVPVSVIHDKLKGDLQQWRDARDRLRHKKKLISPKIGNTIYLQLTNDKEVL